MSKKDSNKSIRTDENSMGKILRKMTFPNFKEAFIKQKTHKVVPGVADNLLQDELDHGTTPGAESQRALVDPNILEVIDENNHVMTTMGTPRIAVTGFNGQN